MTIMCVSGHVIAKVGPGANLVSGAYLHVSGSKLAINSWIEEAESEINMLTRHNWTDAYPNLSLDTRHILQAAASNLAAIYVIQTDLSGFTSRIEAEDKINVLRDALLRELSILRDKKQEDFQNSAT